MKKSGFFWVGFSDLMTSLFFVMLVLYVVTFSILQIKMSEMKKQVATLDNIESIQEALKTLDKKYFEFDEFNKRYKFMIDIAFKPSSDNILDIPINKRKEIYKAGKDLYNKIKQITTKNPDVDYLLIIEGNTQRSNGNEVKIPDVGYKLSYRRSLALFNYWKNNGIDFRNLKPKCEIIIAGSGYFGNSRDTKDERKNRRFTIQITSKIGKLIDKI